MNSPLFCVWLRISFCKDLSCICSSDALHGARGMTSSKAPRLLTKARYLPRSSRRYHSWLVINIGVTSRVNDSADFCLTNQNKCENKTITALTHTPTPTHTHTHTHNHTLHYIYILSVFPSTVWRDAFHCTAALINADGALSRSPC